MLEKLNDLPQGIDGVRAHGKVTKEDYELVFEAIVDAARREGRRIRFLYDAGPTFEGFTAGAAWEDAKLGLRSMRLFDGCAIVSDTGWLRESARLFGFLMPCPVRVFDAQERAKAIEWLRSLPEGSAISPRLLAERGVVVVEVREALRAEDFDALALIVDPWIEALGNLRGLVIHAAAFPGWENLAAVFRHMRFVRGHHRRIKRIAVAADGALASLAPRLGEPFAGTEVRRFSDGEVEDAIAWVAGPAA